MTRRDPDRPRLAATYADHIALNLGQVEVDYPWKLPEGQSGPTVVTSNVSDGESLNPPAVTVHVYSGMRFRRERDETWFEVEGATFWGFRDADPDRTEPNPAIYLNEVPTDDPDSDRLELSGQEFARRIREQEFLVASAVRDYEERGVL